MANDADGSILIVERDIALPEETTARARALLSRLSAEYSYKDSAHPIESGPAVDDVFLLDLPLHAPAAAGSKAANVGAGTFPTRRCPQTMPQPPSRMHPAGNWP